VRGLDEDLDIPAIKAVQGWRFSPATKSKIAIATRMQIEVIRPRRVHLCVQR
jgi:hypothetical protein